MNSEAYKAFQELSEEEWNVLSSKLLAYTINLVNKRHWRHGILPSGINEADIVQIVIKKTLTGERNWDPEKVDLPTFLFSQVRSVISHLLERKEYKHETHVNDADTDISEVIERETNPRNKDNNAYCMSPAELVLSEENEAERQFVVKKKLDAILEAISGEQELEEVFDAAYELIEEGRKICPRNLAEKLGVPTKDIYNRRKRLLRRKEQAERKIFQREEMHNE